MSDRIAKGNGDSVVRVDKWLKQRFPELTNRHIDEAISKGLVLTGTGKRVCKGDKFPASLNLCTKGLAAHLGSLLKGNPGLSIPVIEENTEFLVIDKPQGVLSHPLSLFDMNTVTHWALAHYPDIGENFDGIQPIVVPHRLDRGTSGLLIVCRNRQNFLYWREQFQKNRIRKKYLAWVWGVPPTVDFEMNFSIAHNLLDNRRMVCPGNGSKYRKPVLPAQTMAKVLNACCDRSLLELTSYTGVTHQIRVHLSTLGYPLVGDKLYDPFFLRRSSKMDFHQLRCIELSHEKWSTTLDRMPFQSSLSMSSGS